MTQYYSTPRIVIAGVRGGSGKTILSLGLISAWRGKGLKIVPFKKGPDYIDAGWLALAAGRPCYNLDPFLIGGDKVLLFFVEHFKDSDCAVIEGNRGLYDGIDSEGESSTAKLAKILNAPVLLILDCSKITRTIAAVLIGIQRFDPELRIKGVILNQIAGSRHESVIRDSIKRYCSIPVLGAIPRVDEEFFPERHMGLTPYHEHPEIEKAISTAKEIAQKYLDLDGIWRIAKEATPLGFPDQVVKGSSKLEPSSPRILEPFLESANSPVIGVIKDSAFQFYYPENLEELQKRGARLIEISALASKKLPDIDTLYIGGGFPETHAIVLSDNIDFRNNLREAVEIELPVYAECGGLMYLGESLVIGDRTYPMTGVLPIKFSLERKPQAHGYTIVEVDRPNPYYPVGSLLRGHEFHYSRILNPDAAMDFSKRDDIYFAFKMKRGQGIVDRMDGICYKNVLATYTHIHAIGAGEWADGLINMAVSYRRQLRIH